MNTKIIETRISTILRPTGINLAPYVINPYQGCAMGCCFCYAQFGKTAKKQTDAWGSYVKVKLNAGEVLEKELDKLKPEKVLLGSITECFQPVEEKYQLTQKIIKLLDDRGIAYVLMSRSPLITRYIPLLKQGRCENIYFTINAFPEALARVINEQAPSAQAGLDALNKLAAQGIKVTAYVCPIIPGYDNWKDILKSLKGLCPVECEVINFRMAGNTKLQNAGFYQELLADKRIYDQVMRQLEQDIKEEAAKLGINIKLHSHEYEKYFANEY